MKKVLIIESDRYLLKFKKFLEQIDEYIEGSFFEDFCDFLHIDEFRQKQDALDEVSFCFICIESFDYFNTLNLKWRKPFVVMYSGQDPDLQGMPTLLESSKSSALNIGTIDFSSKMELFVPLLRRVIELIETQSANLGERFLSLEKGLNDSLKSVQKISKKIIPIRKEKIKGITISSKYIAGLDSGGEFFDLNKGENQLTIFLSSVNSYSLSTFFLGFYESVKKLGVVNRDSLTKLFGSIENELNGLLVTPDLRAEITVLVVDLVTYKLWGINFGQVVLKSNINGHIVGNNNRPSCDNLKNSEISLQLKRGEKILIISPGYLKCSEDVFEKNKLLSYIENLEGKDNNEILSELFFQVKKNNLSSDFLKCDSSILCLEVDPNAIMQV
tara:strand:- start:133 stop:1290 length:1158 start_codon:yes stop_codon:yes gene_type:complete